MEIPKKWKTKEVSEATGIPVATLTTWRCLGKGPPYYKLGRSVVYDPVEVEEWLENHKVHPANEE